MNKIKKLISELDVSDIEKELIGEMLSFAYTDMFERCEKQPAVWGNAFEKLFKEDDDD
jgi:hypothetical protein